MIQAMTFVAGPVLARGLVRNPSKSKKRQPFHAVIGASSLLITLQAV
jgi:hypothetical protein